MEYSIEHIWKDFSGKLKYFIKARVSDDLDADEILQEVFIKIHNKMDTLREKEKITGWIYQIARNAIIDYYRQKKNIVELSDNEGISEEEFGDNPHKKFLEGMAELVDKLPDIYKEAIIKTEYEGLSQKELAEKLGISVPGAKSRVQRARNMLRDMIMQCCHFEFDRYGTIIDYHAHTCCCCTPQARSK